jgi:hypothetical protein
MPYSHGVRFEPEVPFVNLRPRLTSTAHIKQLDLDHCVTKACLASPPVLRRGRAGALLDVSTRRLQNSSVVKKCSGTRPENWREEGNHGPTERAETIACRFDLRIPAPKRQAIPRKEVIQPQVPLRLPCYDFTPVTDHSLVGPFLAVEVPTSGATDSHGVTGGVYKARERIHRSVLISDY